MSLLTGEVRPTGLVLEGAETDVTISDPETVYLNGVAIVATYFYETYWYFGDGKGRVAARLSVDLADIGRLPANGGYRLVDELDLKAKTIHEWLVVQDGEELFTANDLWQLRHQHDAWKRERAASMYEDSLSEFREAAAVMSKLDRPVGVLNHLIKEADLRVRNYGQGWIRRGGNASVAEALRAVGNELNRIFGGGTLLLVDDLMDGRLYHRHADHNQFVIDKVKSWSIRTGGFVDMITPEDLRMFYRERLSGIERVGDMRSCDLRLDASAYDPTGLEDDLDEGIAPETVMINGRKGPVSYGVTYDLMEVDGAPVPVGIVSVPKAVYEINAAEYGKKSRFPELPYGIRLFIRVTSEGKEIAKGFDDASLAKQMTKRKRAKNRGNAIAGVGIDDFGFKRWSPITAGELPPWYQGSRVRW